MELENQDRSATAKRRPTEAKNENNRWKERAAVQKHAFIVTRRIRLIACRFSLLLLAAQTWMVPS